MTVFEQIAAHDYERVVFCNDAASGLRAIIAIHDTTLGPALGGIRMYPYANEQEALDDVLRLSRGMTYKAAISGVNLGGGKSVVIGDSRKQKTKALLEAMGHFIETQNGSYIAGQDIGTNPMDLAVVRGVTSHLACVDQSAGGAGDASAATAYGVWCGIRAVLDATTGTDDMEGRHIAIQGLGSVGSRVAKHCSEAGARLTVTDVMDDSIERVVEASGAEVVGPDEIYDVACDVFSPNSIGAVINDATVARLRCGAVAGGANNVLAESRHAMALAQRDIVYAPDYLVNSGGLIQCQEEVLGAPTDKERIFAKVAQIFDQTLEVIEVAGVEKIDTALAADRIAERRIDQVRANGTSWNGLRNSPSSNSK